MKLRNTESSTAISSCCWNSLSLLTWVSSSSWGSVCSVQGHKPAPTDTPSYGLPWAPAPRSFPLNCGSWVGNVSTTAHTAGWCLIESDATWKGALGSWTRWLWLSKSLVSIFTRTLPVFPTQPPLVVMSQAPREWSQNRAELFSFGLLTHLGVRIWPLPLLIVTWCPKTPNWVKLQ